MLDICNNEIKAGHLVHIWWSNPDVPDDSNDYLCTVVRTRGRGIKFVSDDGREFTKEYLEEHNAQIAIQGSKRLAQDVSDSSGKTSPITVEELDAIRRLRELGWYGTIYKKTMSLSRFCIEMPELQ